MKRIIAIIIMVSALICGTAGCSKINSVDSNTIASIGDECISLPTYKAVFDSYIEYMDQLGGGIGSESDLTTFQDMILDYLLMDMMAIYNANKDGFVLPDEDRQKAVEQAKEELASAEKEYREAAEKDYEEDPSKSVDEYFNDYIYALSEYYLGEKLDFAAYSEKYTDEMIRSYTIEAYKEFACKDVKITDEAINSWIADQFEIDEKTYTDSPEQYKYDADYYELYKGVQDDAVPQTYIPAGYSRIMDIVIRPEGKLSDEYNTNEQRMQEIYSECSELMFADALNGDGANADKIAKLLDEYKTLDAKNDSIYDGFTSSVRAEIQKAYDELESGANFVDVMLKYTSDETVKGTEEKEGCEAYRTKGQLISTKYDCGTNDWSSTVKEIFGMLNPGEYSNVFADDDMSFHIIYYVGDEPSGAVSNEEIRDFVSNIVRKSLIEEEWKKLTESWLDDADIKRNMELVRSVGKELIVKDTTSDD